MAAKKSGSKSKAGAPRKAAAKKAAPAKNKTAPTAVSPAAFIGAIADDRRRTDAKILLALFKKMTGEKPVMWGPSIIGFGKRHYKYESGREGDMMLTGFSPRAAASVLYLMGGVPSGDPLLARLGKYRLGKSCLYINRLEDIDLGVLEKLIAQSLAYLRRSVGA